MAAVDLLRVSAAYSPDPHREALKMPRDASARPRRLQDVAQRSGKTAELDAAVQKTLTAAVGAVMAQAIEKAG